MLGFIKSVYYVTKDKLYDQIYYHPRKINSDERIGHDSGYLEKIITLFSEPCHIVDNIYLGSAFNAANYNQLDNLGIQIIINITNEISNYFPAYFNYKQYPIYDDNTDSLLKYLDDSYRYILENKDKKILVHCYAGASRSASVILYYLMKKNNISFEEAYDFIMTKRSIVNISNQYHDDLIKN